jgi:hypothetical protein
MAEVKQVSEPMINFLYALNEAILIKHLGPEMTAEVVAKIPDAPASSMSGFRSMSKYRRSRARRPPQAAKENHPRDCWRRDLIAANPARANTALPNKGRAGGSGTGEPPRHPQGKRHSDMSGKSPRGLR